MPNPNPIVRKRHYGDEEVVTEQQMDSISPQEQRVIEAIIVLYEAGLLEAIDVLQAPSNSHADRIRPSQNSSEQKETRFGYRTYAASVTLDDKLTELGVENLTGTRRSNESIGLAMKELFDRAAAVLGARVMLSATKDHTPQHAKYEISFSLSPEATEILRSVDKQLNSRARAGD